MIKLILGKSIGPDEVIVGPDGLKMCPHGATMGRWDSWCCSDVGPGRRWLSPLQREQQTEPAAMRGASPYFTLNSNHTQVLVGEKLLALDPFLEMVMYISISVFKISLYLLQTNLSKRVKIVFRLMLWLAANIWRICELVLFYDFDSKMKIFNLLV